MQHCELQEGVHVCDVSHLTVGGAEETLHHIVNIVVLQVRVISNGRVVTELVPAEARWGVVTVGKDPCWVGGWRVTHSVRD